MLIKFNHKAQNVIREVKGTIWDAENEFVADVSDAATIENLLTYPNGDFSVAATEPMLSIDGIDEAICLALSLAGVTNMIDLEEAADRPEDVSERSGILLDLVRRYADAARKFMAPKAEQLTHSEVITNGS